jgi:hypothetical protein
VSAYGPQDFSRYFFGSVGAGCVVLERAPVYRFTTCHLYFLFTRFQGAPSDFRLDGVLFE